jgi:hypothetical protein
MAMAGDEYVARLNKVRDRYLAHVSRDGGWPTYLGEQGGGEQPSSILGTAYSLAILRYALVPVEHERIQKALGFLVKEAAASNWTRSRQATHTILGLSEWPEAMVEGAVPSVPGLVPAEKVIEAINQATAWLLSNRVNENTAWPNLTGGHACYAWTASALYSLGRLRQRGYHTNELREVITDAVEWLLESRLPPKSDDFGAWPACGEQTNPTPSLANTAFVVLALSHRGVASIADDPDNGEWAQAYKKASDWLLENRSSWQWREQGEVDAVTEDGWQHILWSLVPRACLSAGAPVHDHRLFLGLRFGLDRWSDTSGREGWAISGDGVSTYSNWSVVQLAQGVRLSISRQDPWYVLKALHNYSPTTDDNVAKIELDINTKTARIYSEKGDRKLDLSRQELRFNLLRAFAVRDARPGTTIDAERLYEDVKGSKKTSSNAWQSLKALVHQVNEAVRREYGTDEIGPVFMTTTRGRKHAVIILVACSLSESDGDVEYVDGADFTGISARIGEAY